MKVIDFIKRLEEIGYDENTELTFGCCDGDTGEWYELEIDTYDGDGFYYGESLSEDPYDKKEINIGIDVDGCTEYIKSKQHSYEANVALDKIVDIINYYNLNYRK